MQNKYHVVLYVIPNRDLNAILWMLFLASRVGIKSKSFVAVVVVWLENNFQRGNYNLK